jgi:hypothetical protein
MSTAAPHYKTAELQQWQAVPVHVAKLLRPAAEAQYTHEKAAAAIDLLSITNATWQPSANTLYVYAPDASTADTNAYKKVASAYRVEFRTLKAAPDWTTEILVKRGSGIPVFSDAWRYSNQMLGGPNAMTNGVVAGLLGAGLGYGGGALLENLFPERYVERGKLRRTLAALGGLGGVGMGAAAAARNAQVFRTNFLDGLFINHNTPVPYIPADQMNPKKTAQHEKQAYPYGQPMYSPMAAPTISVPNFNNAVWHDVQKGFQSNSFAPYGLHTPPQTAAMATGLMSGIGATQRSSIISPSAVIGGIASAGVGLATANIAGRALSALAGLTPAAQHKLQDMGLFAGMLHSVVPAAFGL